MKTNDNHPHKKNKNQHGIRRLYADCRARSLPMQIKPDVFRPSADVCDTQTNASRRPILCPRRPPAMVCVSLWLLQTSDFIWARIGKSASKLKLVIEEFTRRSYSTYCRYIKGIISWRSTIENGRISLATNNTCKTKTFGSVANV